ncbi:MAG: glycoside hydrolase family 13 protein, partial [Clostridia bacterium]|nr:glycoside hydrolase family 13 protein [Clostridia bacterium]
ESGILKKSNQVLFDSRNSTFKKPFGAVSTEENIEIIFPVDEAICAVSVKLFLRRNDYIQNFLFTKEGKEIGYDIFKLVFNVDKPGTYFYRFEIYTNDSIIYCGQDGIGRAILGEWLPEWQLSVYEKGYTTADFIKGGIVYQIFVDRFNKVGTCAQPKYGVMKNWDEDVTTIDPDGQYRANDFFGGNFKGIEEKIPYLKDLGVTCLYLSPIFLSNSNHRYDTADYMQIDPMLGTEDDFRSLVKKCKDNGIAIVLDGVFNHTGADSIYFNKFNHFDSIGACQSEDSKYYDWYTFYDYPNEYNCWWGITVVPTVSRAALSYRKFICDEVIQKWSSFGIKGWRLDVVDELSTDFVDMIREAVKKEDKDALVLGEVWEDASTKYSYDEERQYFYGKELDGVMNYVFKDAMIEYVLKGDVVKFIDQVLDIMENYPKQSLNTCFTLVDSHDTIRILNYLADVDCSQMTKEEKKHRFLTFNEYLLARKRLYFITAIQFFLPGVPTIYYGDEVGMQGFEDPLNRRPFPWGKEDEQILKHYKYLGNLRKKHRKDFIEYPRVYMDKKNNLIIERKETVLKCNQKTLNFSIEEKSI